MHLSPFLLRPISRHSLLLIAILSLLFLTGTITARAQTFQRFLNDVAQTTDSTKKSEIISQFIAAHPEPFCEDSTAWFYYRGAAHSVAVPGDFNEWNPAATVMRRIQGTNFFYAPQPLPSAARAEYKIWVDSSWGLDSMNPRTSLGGYGPNSDVWMPRYVPLEYPDAEDIPAGRLDTIWFTSKYLHVRHPVIVYVPSIKVKGRNLPSLWVTDGADYIKLSEITRIMDIHIFNHKIRPTIGVFIEPRTMFDVDSTNRRMDEYSADNRFLDFLQREVQPLIAKKYGTSTRPSEKVLMGASMGGIISTYALLARPSMFANCASQSPAYRMADSIVFKLSRTVPVSKDLRFYIDTGTIHDTEGEAAPVAAMLKKRGFDVEYATYPEGHNWKNWRSRIPRILTKFFGSPH